MSKLIKTLTVLAVLAPVSAGAGEISLTAPMQGATLHEAGLDMSVYFTEASGGYEVVATYVSANATPNRIRMLLTDGDNVSFSLPGHNNVVYNFNRNQTKVGVTAEQVQQYATLTN